MFRKLNGVFGAGGGRRGKPAPGPQQDYHSACTVRLVRSTSMLVVGGDKGQQEATLRRSQSSLSLSLCFYQRQEDQLWLYSQNQSCLEYLEALVALRRQYGRDVAHLQTAAAAATSSAPSPKKKAPPPPPPPPPHRGARPPAPSAPPAPSEEDSLLFLDEVIASCDSEAQQKPYQDNGHADVDFIVASSSADHDLHSNWVLRVPRVAEGAPRAAEGPEPAASRFRANRSSAKQKQKQKQGSGSGGGRLQLQRNPIHLPKVVQSALHSLRLTPKHNKH